MNGVVLVLDDVRVHSRSLSVCACACENIESEGKKEKRKDGTQERKGLERKKKGTVSANACVSGGMGCVVFLLLVLFFWVRQGARFV